MSAPAYTKLPTEEPGSPSGVATPQSPAYTEAPAAHTVLPPSYPTAHRPPPAASLSTTDNDDDDDEVKTININIVIKIPKSIQFPCFRRRCGRRDGAFATRDGIPREEKKRRFFVVMMALFYLSFVICSAVAWGLKRHIWEYSPVPLAIITFSPFIDFFIVGATILRVRRISQGQKPGFGFAFLIMTNITLFLLHLIIMIIAAGPWTHTYGYGWYYGGRMRAIVGLALYSVSGMTAIKLILALWVIRRRTMVVGGLRENIRAFREEFRQAMDGVDGADVSQAEEGDARRSQEGRVYLS